MRGAQGAQANEPFPRAARRALAHGRATEAEALAKARPANDPAAAAVLARLAIHRGGYDEALKILEPAAAADPRSDAALELGLLSQRLGRTSAGDAAPDRPVTAGRAPARMRRRCCAPAARRMPWRCRTTPMRYFKAAADARGGDPAVQTAYGAMFLDIFYAADALKAFQAAIAADPEWAPALRRRRAHAGGREPDRRRRGRDQGARDRSGRSPTRTSRWRRWISTAPATMRRASASTRCWRSTSGPRRAVAARGDRLRTDRPRGVRRRGQEGARDQPGFGEVYRVAADLAAQELPVRRGGRADARSGGARPRQHAGLRRPRPAADADRRRSRGAAGARPRLQRERLRQDHQEPARSARQPEQVRRRAGRRPHVQVQPGRDAGDARVCNPAGARRAEDAVGEVSVHAARGRSWSRSSRTTTTSRSATWACPA